MSARILCTVECKLIQVGFHRPFATKTTADDVCSKQKGTNEWYIIASPPKVSGSPQQDLTQIYSFIISITVEIVDHQMTYVTTNHSRQEDTFTFHNPADLLFSNLIGSTLHMNNETNEQSAFRNNGDFGCKIYKHLLESPREFELIQGNFIFGFSVGSKGARDDWSHLVGEW